MKRLLVSLGFVVFFCATLLGQQQPGTVGSVAVDAATLARWSKIAGLDLTKVDHHCYLLKHGAAFEYTAKNAEDKETIAAIQKFVTTQVKQLEKGNIEQFAALYGKTPDSLSGMKRLKREINFDGAPSDNGAVFRFLTTNAQALAAVQDFARFDINEFKTGDPTTAD